MNAATLSHTIATLIKNRFGATIEVEVTRAEEKFGDYATNAALQLAGKLQKNPREVAEVIVEALRTELAEQVQDITIAGPGFINLTLHDKTLATAALRASETIPHIYKDQVIVAEYSDPNPFKVLHAGHLYTSIVGDAIANLMEKAGGEVHRVNFGGDVGLHAAKNMWAIIKFLGGELPEKLADVPKDQRADWLSQRYVEGNTAYEHDEQAKAEITDVNKKIYTVHEQNDRALKFARIYWTCRQWSYDYFDQFYARLGSKFEKYYPESSTASLGLKIVREQLAKGIYKKSEGAVVFEGEKYGLHTRVFITSQGLPTYEAKDIGLIMAKWQDYHFDTSVIITGNDIIEYMKVVLKSLEQFAPDLPRATRHVTHGNVRLQGGIKMSSRKGNILRAVEVLDIAAKANKQATGQDNEQAVLAAVKYAFLKQRTGQDIIYNPQESVSLEGNSGPYLQYAHARARSILRKSGSSPASVLEDLEAGERPLARKIAEYPEVLERASRELMPHHVCTYLYELAQAFNRFYEHNRVIGDPRQAMRLSLVQSYSQVLKNGLEILGISAPEQL